MLEALLEVATQIDPLFAVIFGAMAAIIVYIQKKSDKRETKLQEETVEIRRQERDTYRTVLVSLDKVADGMYAAERDREKNLQFQTRTESLLAEIRRHCRGQESYRHGNDTGEN